MKKHTLVVPPVGIPAMVARLFKAVFTLVFFCTMVVVEYTLRFLAFLLSAFANEEGGNQPSKTAPNQNPNDQTYFDYSYAYPPAPVNSKGEIV